MNLLYFKKIIGVEEERKEEQELKKVWNNASLWEVGERERKRSSFWFRGVRMGSLMGSVGVPLFCVLREARVLFFNSFPFISLKKSASVFLGESLIRFDSFQFNYGVINTSLFLIRSPSNILEAASF